MSLPRTVVIQHALASRGSGGTNQAARRWLSLAAPPLLSACSHAQSGFLAAKGPVAHAQSVLFYDVIGVMLVVIVPVFILMPLWVWKYRRANRHSDYQPKWEFSWLLEIVVWGIPGLVVIVLGIKVWTETHRLDPYRVVASAQAPLVVQVVGLDWKWLFIYPQQHIATVNQLVFPVDRPLQLELTSDTVMQSFMIPQLGGQIYAMAGMRTELNLMADQLGHYGVENTQYNGDGFAKQRFRAQAVSAAEFAHWVVQAHTGGAALDAVAYQALAVKSVPAHPLVYSSVEPRLFQQIINKYHDGHTVAQMTQEARP
ncbi:MAG: ubiquinol oxidase subunit II [Proteobacteria bacterium]|nr:ubiquinol oxidase subunit II [Pseudomonadota bacterium]